MSAEVDKFSVESRQEGPAMEKEPDPSFLTPREAAKLLNLPTHTIRIMIHRKELLAFKVGSHWRISQSEVTKLIARSE